MIGFEVEVGEPQDYPSVRHVTITFAGVPVFSDLVYDTVPGDTRSEEQARQNALNLFAYRLARAVAQQ